MSWNIGDNRNLFLKLQLKLGLYHVVLTTPETSPEKHTLTVDEMQQLPDTEKTHSREKLSCLKWTKNNGTRKVCVILQTDTDKLNTVIHCYRTSFYLKENEVDLKMTVNQSLLVKLVQLMSDIDILYKRCIELDENKTIHN